MSTMTRDQIWKSFNRMQRDCMAKESIITRQEFFAEPEEEQKSYYNWMRQQTVSFGVRGPYWY